ncbi:hypothetical protein ABB37_04488 [Leptomonas pyrrhocoris]|uniref:Uncharacterized protein n=1 Tax=Leptomonas pyrrhocoris TaxID=157538 RepID=A0A0M9G2P7_LEPPY|nr:hypothetical protein ABB37_04488 [Leptomonas pyrrhocoris]KPA81145.1 hypothetical protein ABB37_04488 [Leptomonas pyrrhocoris]|eukprot:XP_015659584.1 hypothetical protein ABB37_04488 [Leptomonas pyrrhocoris]
MSGMDDRAKQFKMAAESHLTGPALKKEINTLRRFLFRNQEYRFTKAAQQALYMAVLAHYGNDATHHASCLPAPAPASTSGTSTSPSSSTPGAGFASSKTAATGQADNDEENGQGDDDDTAAAAAVPILHLLDEALKMPFTVFTSPQKDKLLSLYWAVLGTAGPPGGNRNAGNAAAGGGAAAAGVCIARQLSLMDVVEAGKSKATLSLYTEDGNEYAHEVFVDDAATLKQLKRDFDEGNAVVVTVQETNTGARFLSFSVDAE